MSIINEVEFVSLGDGRGGLVSIEQLQMIPFEIKRVYYLYGMKGDTPRGFHAHKELNQFAICITGSCRMILDNGLNKEEVVLASPVKGVLIDKMIWHEMHDFSDDCVLLVLASDHYDESDYIRKYNEFIALAGSEYE